MTKRNPNAGLTLLEVMIVLAVIALIAGLAAPRLLANFGKAQGRSAEIQLTNIKGAVQMFYIDTGRYPTEAEGLDALLTAPDGLKGWRGPYVDDDKSITDPWGHRYVYHSPGQTKPFDLLSYGRDGRAGGSGEDSDISL
ncbi:type II secretion system major pseudopilin GspG [Stagnihabitans tardus]|uniref:Type II secretion system core protein G n=1 Tax=Stagnihabitans tardus TaxID=2699202 RepID=A0AAE5BUF9_9RHOB|nr:type II secretion system major pseudopilin GspG [Stagnihabitans tardus]NBZ90080.1 type II secretion system major pseudopilin GspG [Stagnihabitans tardus]